MKVEKIYIQPNSKLSTKIASWVAEQKLPVEEVRFDEEFNDLIDGLLILNQNQDVDIELLKVRKRFDENQKPVQRIDINGTLMVGVSNFSLWLERNGCQHLLIIGNEGLIENKNLDRYLEKMKLK